MRLFELLIGDVLTDEVFAISLVSEPAIEENFVWFANEKMQFQKIDNEKRLVVGPVLIPNKKILRIDGEGQPYEVFFSPETIEKLAQNYLKKGYQGETTIEHEERVAGVSLVESWIKTTKLDKSNSYGLNLPVGTWMGAFKVDSDIIWEDYVKNGEVKGFSIEGLFEHSLVEAAKEKVNVKDLSEEQSEQYLNQIRAIVKQEAQPSVSGTYPGEVAKEDIKLDHELILFPTKEMAERVAKLLGCEGSHEHKIDTGETYYMPCEQHKEEIMLEDVRVNEGCPDGFEHLMPDGSYMCGKSMDYANKYSNNERRDIK